MDPERKLTFTLVELLACRGVASRAKCSTAFTLIELLVVISILLVVMGLLFPVLSKSKMKSKATICMSNERQIAQAFILYSNEYNGIMVAGRMPDNTAFDVGNGLKWRPRWYAQVGISGKFYAFSNPSPLKPDDNPQRVDNKAFLCPEKPVMDNGRNYCYGYNFQFLGNSRKKSSGAYISWPRKIDIIKNHSGTVMFADCMGTAAGKAKSSRLPYDDSLRFASSANTFKIGNHAWALDPPKLVAGSSDYCDDASRAPEHRSAIYPVHLNRANVAFLDGHVESKSLEELGYQVGEDGTIGLNGDNKFFSGTGANDNPPDIN